MFSANSLVNNSCDNFSDKHHDNRDHSSYRRKSPREERILTNTERKFMLNAERGDCASVAKIIEAGDNQEIFDINCTDPLGRTALSIAIINENPELIEILLDNGIKTRDSLLLAIDEEYVEGVELLLEHEERIWKAGTLHSWEIMDPVRATYTPDITPLKLAAHKNNYEILKILIDRGATVPGPHDIKCNCEECRRDSKKDSLRFSMSRLNAYKALSSPSLIALTSKDPILTAFKLSDQLKNLSKMESQFCKEYTVLREQVQSFATSLLDHARSSYELEVMLNYNNEDTVWSPGHHQTLDRLKLAIKCKQKSFVAHPNVQQMLGSIWYEGVPSFRRVHILQQSFIILKLCVMYPFYCIMYMLAPNSGTGEFIKNPFIKFICHSSSYIFFLMLLAMASQRIEYLIVEILAHLMDDDDLYNLVLEWERTERGSLPSYVETVIILWQVCLLWRDIKVVYKQGLAEYITDLWNMADWFTNLCFISWIILRFTSCYMVSLEIAAGQDPYLPREEWYAYDPYLISEGLFGAGMISSYLKIVQILSVNPHLGPLQISLGRMILDIMKWKTLNSSDNFSSAFLVLFAFSCGINQLLWYYAALGTLILWLSRSDQVLFNFQKRKYPNSSKFKLASNLNVKMVLEKKECEFSKDKSRHAACLIWRRFCNLFETTQSLFWAVFGLVNLSDFELKGIKEFTRFWALLMFGIYSCCNIIVLLNMLIAMMSNSYQSISVNNDREWKFARTKLWISYFEPGSTLPPPFNILPTVKSFFNVLKRLRGRGKKPSDKYRGVLEAKLRHQDIMRCIIKRYIMSEQKKAEEFGITEDDVSEIRQDINKFRFELVDILRKNNFDIGKVRNEGCYGGKRAKQMERRIMKGFNLDIHGLMKDSIDKQTDKSKTVDIFQVMADAIQKETSKNNQINFGPSVDASKQYSPATLAAAKKFKRFLGKHLRPEPGEVELRSNHIKYNSITAPTSPVINRLTPAMISADTETVSASDGLNMDAVCQPAVIPCTLTLTHRDLGSRAQLNSLDKRRKNLENSFVNVETMETCENRNTKQERLEISDLPICRSKLTSLRKQSKVTSGWI